MKHILVTFDNDEDAEIFIEAMEEGVKFDFNGRGRFVGENDEWEPSYRHWGFTVNGNAIRTIPMIERNQE